MKTTTVCFTGHRPTEFGGYDESLPQICYIKNALRDKIESAILNGYDTFISGMACGVDMWAAEAVIELQGKYSHIKLVAAIPFAEQASVWPEHTQERWTGIITKASETKYVSPSGYAAWKMQVRNVWMVDHASLVIAVWNGAPGGTNNCIVYAKQTDTAIEYIDMHTA